MTTNGGVTDRRFDIIGDSTWPIRGRIVNVARHGSGITLRWGLGDPDSDAWYTFDKQ